MSRGRRWGTDLERNRKKKYKDPSIEFISVRCPRCKGLARIKLDGPEHRMIKANQPVFCAACWTRY